MEACQGSPTNLLTQIKVVGNPIGSLNSQNSMEGGMTHLVHCTPRISFFSGEDPPNKNEKTYEQWLFDVKTIRPSYLEGLLKEAIFGSLKVNAANVARI